MSEMGLNLQGRIFCDSSAGRAMANRSGVSSRTRHVEAKFLYVQQLIRDKKINLHGIKGTKNVADGGTKYLDQRKNDIFKTKLGKGSSHPSQSILYQDYDVDMIEFNAQVALTPQCSYTQ